ncbi:MAG: hypothetical protein AAF447_02900 [Myxococcota bacterium]
MSPGHDRPRPAYNVAAVLRRHLHAHALVAVWALVAIAVRQWDGAAPVKWGALVAAALILAVVSAHALRGRSRRA